MGCKYKKQSGYCDLVQEKVNPPFCEKVCRGNWRSQRKRIADIKLMLSTKQLSYEQVWLNTVKALSGTNRKMVTVEEYIKRRNICLECNGGTKCPHYCCDITVKLALKEFVCKEGKLN